MPKRQDIPDCHCGGTALLASTNLRLPVLHRVQCELCGKATPWSTRPSRAYDAWRKGRRVGARGSSTFTLQLPSEIGASKWDGASEDDVTDEIMAALRDADFAAVTDPTIAAGWWFANRIYGKGNTPGQPDLWLRKHRWPEGVWLAIEIKGRDGKAVERPVQQVLNTGGAIYVCWTAQMVLDAVLTFDGAFHV